MTENQLIQHFVKHGDPQCPECIEGLRAFFAKKRRERNAKKRLEAFNG